MGRVVFDGAIDELALATRGTVDATTVLGRVVVNVATDERGFAFFVNGTAVFRLVAEKFAIFDDEAI